jgi:hypothetical protein
MRADPNSVFRLAFFLLFPAIFLVNLLDPNSYSSESLNLGPQSWFLFLQARKILF